MRDNALAIKSNGLDKIRAQLARHGLPALKLLDNISIDSKLEGDISLDIDSTAVQDGVIVGTVLCWSKVTARLYGIYLNEKRQTKGVNKENYRRFAVLERPGLILCEPEQVFLQEKCELDPNAESKSMKFEFYIDGTMPNSCSFQYQDVRTVVYLVEISGVGAHLIRTVQVKYVANHKNIEKELAYSCLDFQRLRICCLNQGIFRLQATFTTNRHEKKQSLIGKINFFSKVKGTLIHLKCKIDLIGRLRLSIKGNRQYFYSSVASKTIFLQGQPIYGMLTGIFRLPLQQNLPTSCNNPLFDITYFLLITPMSDDGRLKILQEQVREMLVVESS